jgi:hypothetical protein
MDDQAPSVINALRSGEFRLSLHAARRMKQRSITMADIQACGKTAKSCIYQREMGTYRIIGKDIDGETLAVICGIDKSVIIVTIF